MTRLGSYLVSVLTRDAGNQTALLTSALFEDMATDWTFDWPVLWQRTDISCQNIIKLVAQEQVWGLVRSGLYPYPGTPRFLEIEQLEANPTSRGEIAFRLIEPIGKWLQKVRHTGRSAILCARDGRHTNFPGIFVGSGFIL